MNRGKLVILGIVVLAIGLGGIAWWLRFEQGARVLNEWPDHARLIHDAPDVEFLTLAEPDHSKEPPSSESVEILGERWAISRPIDLRGAAGLLHARHTLVQDTSYQWESRVSRTGGRWDFLLRFRQSPRQATLAFDLDQSRVCLIETGSVLRMQDFLNQAMRKKFDDWQKLMRRPG